MSSIKESTSALVHSGVMPWATVFAVLAAMLIGVFIVAGIGFAGPEAIHNATHDLRHGLAFPCH